ncbi:hypothetical protein Q5752_002099 [Cryptotrichosporon argae]
MSSDKLALGSRGTSPARALDRADERALRPALRKLDMFFLPAVTAIYFLNFLDRSNIGNAKTAGLATDLHLSSRQYSIALTVTYVPYIVAELPVTLLMNKVGPNILLPTLAILWGVVTTFQGFVSSFGGLVAARFFLGACEGAILPGSIAYLSTFYRRRDLGKRVAFFYSATSLAGAFSGLLAAAIIHMDGKGGKKGWQWIFILEGLFTIVWGALSLFILPRSIAATRYLSADEKTALAAAHEAETLSNAAEERLSRGSILAALKSPQVWLVFVPFFCNGAGLYALAYFAPTIVQSLGYTGTSVQLHSVPPYVCSAVLAVALCFLSDRQRHRGLFAVAAALIAVVGYALYLGSTRHSVLYASLFLQTMGQYTLAPLYSTWMPNNLRSYYTRTTGIVLGFVATNAGGILATWLFPAADSPRFHRASSVLLGLTCALIPFTLANSLYMRRLNTRAEARRAAVESSGGEKEDEFVYIT